METVPSSNQVPFLRSAKQARFPHANRTLAGPIQVKPLPSSAEDCELAWSEVCPSLALRTCTSSCAQGRVVPPGIIGPCGPLIAASDGQWKAQVASFSMEGQIIVAVMHSLLVVGT